MNASYKSDVNGRSVASLRSDFRADRPLQMELAMLGRIFSSLELNNPTCLDIGVTNPFGALSLREMGGYWSSVATSGRQVSEGALVLGEEPLAIGTNGELPFEDKQFDVVVLARGSLKGESEHDQLLIQECHRILKPPGYLIMAVNYRKRLDAVRLFYRGGLTLGGCNERELFELLKKGFDVLGVRTYCRFWMQLTRLMLDQRGRTKGRTTASLYWLAHQLDLLLFFTKGYQMVAYGRRKGWRERDTLGQRHGVSIGEALLQRTRT